MLQYILTPPPGSNPAELVSRAIQGGCRWIELYMPDSTDEQVRTVAKECIPLCSEQDVFLIIYSHVDVVEELRVSGIRVGTPAAGPVMRLKLGPHAVVGVAARTVSEIIGLRGRDIDYVTVDGSDPEAVANMMIDLGRAGNTIPVVATGATPDTAPALIQAGVSGIAMSDPITDSHDPAACVAAVLAAIQSPA